MPENRASLMAHQVKSLPACRRYRSCGFDSWVKKIPWRRKWQLTPVLFPGKSHGQRNVVGYSPWGLKESDTIEQLHFTSLHSYFKILKAQFFFLSYGFSHSTFFMKLSVELCIGEGNGTPLQ